MKSSNIKLNPKKCVLCQPKVKFLGHVISKKGISTNKNKVKSVSNWPTPRSVRDVRSFLGLCSYYKKFVNQFATIAKPLHKLTKKGNNFCWTNNCKNSFTKLKKKLTNAPLLAYPRSNKIFIINCNASQNATESVLSQIQNKKKKWLLITVNVFLSLKGGIV